MMLIYNLKKGSHHLLGNMVSDPDGFDALKPGLKAQTGFHGGSAHPLLFKYTRAVLSWISGMAHSMESTPCLHILVCFLQWMSFLVLSPKRRADIPASFQNILHS